jgi:DNA mismatch endonuclease (patch repair protein)
MDTLTRKERSERMRRVKGRDTKPERQIRQLVWGLGYRYRKHRRDVTGNPDLAFIGRRRAIFVHGCFWHRHKCTSGQRSPKSRIAFWNEKFRRNVARDAFVAKQLKLDGWKSLVIWECELRKPEKIQTKIKRFLDA